MTTLTTVRGGSWLIEDTPAESVFTPESLSDEHRLIGQTADEFVANEVLPAIERLEQKDWKLARQLVRRAGELGLLGTDVAEAFGGVGLDKVGLGHRRRSGRPIGVVCDDVRRPDRPRDYAARLFRHRGTEGEVSSAAGHRRAGRRVCAQRVRIGLGCARRQGRATRQPDGSFILSGEKMWITNGGFADLFIVFAKVVNDGEEPSPPFSSSVHFRA